MAAIIAAQVLLKAVVVQHVAIAVLELPRMDAEVDAIPPVKTVAMTIVKILLNLHRALVAVLIVVTDAKITARIIVKIHLNHPLVLVVAIVAIADVLKTAIQLVEPDVKYHVNFNAPDHV